MSETKGNSGCHFTAVLYGAMLGLRLNSESWPRAGNPGSDLCKTDLTETNVVE